MNFINPYGQEKKKKEGIFHTPEDIALFMVNKTKVFDDGKGIWLDPCCGLGVLSILLASIQEDPIDFIKNRLIINEKDEHQLAIALNNFMEKFGVIPRSYNEDFLTLTIDYDYVIMNPPYFKYMDNDIYAYFLDVVTQKAKGFISINPMSFSNGRDFKKTREGLLTYSSLTTYHFDNIPGHIFYDATVRVSIIIAHNTDNNRKTTTQIRWQSNQRDKMILTLDDKLDDGLFTKDIFYKTSPNTTKYIHNDTLSKYTTEKTEYPLYITSTPRYFISASTKKLDRSGQIVIYLKDLETYHKALILLNSTYLYWWWRTSDSSMTLTKKTLMSLPWVDTIIDNELIQEILESENTNKVYKMNAGKKQENIKHPMELVSKLNNLFIDVDLLWLHK